MFDLGSMAYFYHRGAALNNVLYWILPYSAAWLYEMKPRIKDSHQFPPIDKASYPHKTFAYLWCVLNIGVLPQWRLEILKDTLDKQLASSF